MLSLHELEHERETRLLPGHIVAWMRKNWKKHVDDGRLDAESLAEQASFEFGCPRQMADELAVEFKQSVESEEETKNA